MSPADSLRLGRPRGQYASVSRRRDGSISIMRSRPSTANGRVHQVRGADTGGGPPTAFFGFSVPA